MDQFYPPVYRGREDSSMVLPGGGEDGQTNTKTEKPNKHKEINNMRK